MAKISSKTAVKPDKQKLHKKSPTENADKKLLSIRDVKETVVDEFWKFQEKYQSEQKRLINGNEVLELIIQDAKKEPGLTLSEGQFVYHEADLNSLNSELKALQNQNIDLIEQLSKIDGENVNAITELEEKLKNALDDNAIIAKELIELSQNTPELKEGEFICKISAQAFDIVNQLKPFLEKNKIIVVPEGEGFTETLANYCIVNMLTFNYRHLLK